MTLEQLAKQTSYTSDMQRYFLACVEEFGEDFKQFIAEVAQVAYDVGYEDGYEAASAEMHRAFE